MDLPRTYTEAKKLNSHTYFTGQPCKHGHISERYTSTGSCIECYKIKNKVDDSVFKNNPELSRLPRTKSEAEQIGSEYYFTGKPCRNGHIDKRNTKHHECFSCRPLGSDSRPKPPEPILIRERFDLPSTVEDAIEIGSKFYFPNLVCKHGHLCERLVQDKYCYECHLISKRKSTKKFAENNKEKVAQSRKKYRKNNIEKVRKWKKEWRDNNLERARESEKRIGEKRRNNLKFKIDRKILGGMSDSIKDIVKGIRKIRKWENMVDFCLEDFIFHMESLFKDGMSWNNHGEWHMDHIKPLSLCETHEESWNLNNIQPLWATDNLRKHTQWVNNE